MKRNFQKVNGNDERNCGPQEVKRIRKQLFLPFLFKEPKGDELQDFQEIRLKDDNQKPNYLNTFAYPLHQKDANNATLMQMKTNAKRSTIFKIHNGNSMDSREATDEELENLAYGVIPKEAGQLEIGSEVLIDLKDFDKRKRSTIYSGWCEIDCIVKSGKHNNTVATISMKSLLSTREVNAVYVRPSVDEVCDTFVMFFDYKTVMIRIRETTMYTGASFLQDLRYKKEPKINPLDMIRETAKTISTVHSHGVGINTIALQNLSVIMDSERKTIEKVKIRHLCALSYISPDESANDSDNCDEGNESASSTDSAKERSFMSNRHDNRTSHRKINIHTVGAIQSDLEQYCDAMNDIVAYVKKPARLFWGRILLKVSTRSIPLKFVSKLSMLDSVEDIYNYLTRVYNHLKTDAQTLKEMNRDFKYYTWTDTYNIGTYMVNGKKMTHSTNNWFMFLILCRNIVSHSGDFHKDLDIGPNRSIFESIRIQHLLEDNRNLIIEILLLVVDRL